MHDRNAPRPKAHQIGDYGERLVASTLPADWVIHHYKGSEDYGIDLHVEIFAEGKPTGLEFGIQVKSMERVSRHKAPRVRLTRNNLMYIASKTYPTMIAVASIADRSVAFTWVGEIFTLNSLLEVLRRPVDKKWIPVVLSPNYDLSKEADGIVEYAKRVKENLGFWLRDEQNRRHLTNTYFDLQAALDALIEFKIVSSLVNFSEDQRSHKATFTMSLVLACYFFVRDIALEAKQPGNDPSLASFFHFYERLRQIVVKIVPEDSLQARESGADGQMGALFLLPGSISELDRNALTLVWAFRDGLRDLGRYLAPWREFNMGMSGLAGSVIDYGDDAA
jgi:hypothetical protein